MTVPTLNRQSEQAFAVADNYWMCGDDIILNTLPSPWIGLCTSVRLKLPAPVVYKGVRGIISVDEFPDKIHRSKRGYTPESRVYLHDIVQPRGIPEEFKAQKTIKAGLESIFL